MDLLSDIRLVLLQNVLHKSMGLIMKRPLLRLLESHLFEPSAIAAASKWDFFQMDVKNVFLNRNLSEEVYMQPPPVSLLNRKRFVTFDEHFMALNKLYELGLPSSALPSLAWVTLSSIMILPYFFVTSSKAPFFFFYMWMI